MKHKTTLFILLIILGMVLGGVGCGERLTETEYRNPTWAPDGKIICEKSVHSYTYHKWPNTYTDNTYEHYITEMNDDGSGERNLCSVNATNFEIAISQDNNKIAYTNWNNNKSEIRILNRNNLSTEEIYYLDNYNNPTSLNWCPIDNSSIIFSAHNNQENTYTNQADIFILNSKNGELKKMFKGRDPNWPQKSNNNVIVYMNYDYKLAKYYFDISSSESYANINGAWFSWSPDASKIAFIDGDIKIIDSFGNLIKVVNNMEKCFHPIWSLSGDKILFEDSESGIYLLDTNIYLLKKVK